MIKPLDIKEVRDLSGGMVSFADDSLLPDNVCKFALNLHFDNLGRATQRNGTTQLGATVDTNQQTTGIFNFVSYSAGINALLVGFGTGIFAYQSGSWSQVASGLNGTPIRMVAFSNNVLLVGGGINGIYAWNGTGSFGPIASLTSAAPQGTYIDVFNETIYIAGNTNFPSRLYFSQTINPDGSVTWIDPESLEVDYIDINPDDNNIITGLKKISNLLLIFKKYAQYRYDGTSVSSALINDIGASTQESVQNIKGMVYFFTAFPLGIFATDGTYPTEVSRPIFDWMQAIPASNYGSITATVDSDHYYCNIGNITVSVNGTNRTFNNVWVVYTISSQAWTIYSFAQNFGAMGRYINPATGSINLVAGNSLGQVETILTGTSDNGTPISWEYQSKQWEFDGRGSTDAINTMSAYVVNGAGSKLSVAPDTFAFVQQGQTTDTVNIFRGLNIQGHYFSVKLEGVNSGTPVVLNGYGFVSLQSLGYLDE